MVFKMTIFQDRLVTRAVLYFTGEAQAAEREEEFDEDMYDEGDEGEDPDFEPKVSVLDFLNVFYFLFLGRRTGRL